MKSGWCTACWTLALCEWISGQGEVPWEVLADPEGDEFCVLPEEGTGDRLAAICLDAVNPADQGRFWAAATGWPIMDQGEWDVSLRSSARTRPALVMVRRLHPSEEEPAVPGCRTLSGDDASAEATRLLHAGASRVDIERGRAPWQMLADPEGNEFRVLQPQPPKPSAH